MSLPVFQEILGRATSAPAFHSGQRDLHLFLSLPGFAALHEYQFHEESETLLKAKGFCLDYYGRLPPSEAPEGFALLSGLFGEKSRFEITGDQKWNAVKESFKGYGDWEEESWQLYQAKAKELREQGEITAARFAEALADGVFRELSRVNGDYLAYKGMDWDLPTLTAMQPELQGQWERKKRQLFR